MSTGREEGQLGQMVLCTFSRASGNEQQKPSNDETHVLLSLDFFLHRARRRSFSELCIPRSLPFATECGQGISRKGRRT